jgi:putative mRNA 3-end processing factor
MIRLEFLGALSFVGCSAVLVDTGKERIVLDYGTKLQEIPPKFPLPIQGKVDAVILSHCHLDHSGAVPLFNANHNSVPVYAKDVTRELCELLWLDSIKISREEGITLPFTKHDVERTVDSFSPVRFRQPFRIKDTKAMLFDAGHIPGSAMPFLDIGGKTILYTGDYKTVDSRLLKKADTDLPNVDVLITESTYAYRDHPERKSQEKQLVETINNTLAVDGVCLVAGFAVGRLDEILLVLDSYGIDYPLYIDGMAKKAITIINQHKRLMKEPGALDRALKKAEYIKDEKKRKKIIRQPCVILTTSGMLSGGPIAGYIKKLYDNRDCSLVLTGFQVEGTPGKVLLETGKFINKELNLDMKMFVKRLDFSAHLGRADLFDFIEKVNPKKVFCVHGDHTEEFAAELKEKGFDATAPLANNRVFEI